MRFALKAVDSSNQVVALDVEAADETAARRVAGTRGYAVLTLQRKAWFAGRRTRFSKLLISIELLALLDAGLNVVEALQTLAENAPEGEGRRLLEEVLEALYRGQTLSQALEQFPEVFSALYVATIRSSERTGNIKDALGRYIAYQEELNKVRNKVAAALLYPAILLAVGTLVLGFLMFYVVPRFALVYEDISTDLPLLSNVLFIAGRWIGAHSVAILASVGAAAGFGIYLLSKDGARASLVAQLWRIPTLGEHVRIYDLARLYRALGMLLRAGIPALRAFGMVSGLLPVNLRAQLGRSAGLLESGCAISVALTSAGLATPVATRLMAVGEKSGQMGELMERIARFYDDETARFVDSFLRVFEPALMAILGVAVGLVVILMYMPVFELAGSVR